MIVEILMTIIYVLVLGISKIFYVLSDVTASSHIVESITNANSYMQPVSHILPTGTILLIFGFSVVFEISYFSYKGVNWIIRKIPTIS